LARGSPGDETQTANAAHEQPHAAHLSGTPIDRDLSDAVREPAILEATRRRRQRSTRRCSWRTRRADGDTRCATEAGVLALADAGFRLRPGRAEDPEKDRDEQQNQQVRPGRRDRTRTAGAGWRQRFGFGVRTPVTGHRHEVTRPRGEDDRQPATLSGRVALVNELWRRRIHGRRPHEDPAGGPSWRQ